MRRKDEQLGVALGALKWIPNQRKEWVAHIESNFESLDRRSLVISDSVPPIITKTSPSLSSIDLISDLCRCNRTIR